MQSINDYSTEDLKRNICEGIFKKKGKEIVLIDFDEIENAICQYFIICHGDSNTQVEAITESVEKTVKENLKEKVWHREGLENAQWVLLDYGDIIVHIFQKDYRDYYKLTELWADAEISAVEEDEND